MSYNVRDDAATFGPGAAVEFPNGAGQSTIGCIQAYEPVGIFGATGTGGTAPNFVASTYYTVFLSPPSPSATSGNVPLGQQYRVVQVDIFYSTAASGAATLLIEICGPGVANGSGTNVLSATNYALNTALTAANTPQTLPLSSNIDNLTLAPNSRLNIYTGGTSTAGLADLTISIAVVRTI
jgi:hypothetical protein